LVSREEREKFRILWHSVAPYVRSGYGNLTRQVCGRLKEYGFDIYVSAYYGIEPGGVLLINNIPCLPAKTGRFGEISYLHYYKTLKANLGVLFSDPWAFDWFPSNLPNTLCAGPFDHENYPVEIQEMIRKYTYRASPSKFQVKEWAKYKPSINWDYVPHGVDTKIFYPMDKKEAKKSIGIPEDTFVIGTVAANSDKENRKGFTQSFKALQMFFANNPDVKKDQVKFFLYTNPQDARGLQIELFLRKCELSGITVLQNPMVFETGIKDSELANIYNAFDVQLYPSFREGWGMTITEASSCGVPNIGHDFSSMPEQIEGRGWLCKSAIKDHATPINADTAIPDVTSISQCIEEAYFKPDLLAKYGREARKFALTLDWDDVVKDIWVPLLDNVIEDTKCKPIDQRKIA
jgi:glycosyltransferase involved in cell wall biosynthesis